MAGQRRIWEFVEHRFARPTRWTWTQLGQSGRVIQKSATSYSSLAAAVTGAAVCGFDAASDGYQVINLE